MAGPLFGLWTWPLQEKVWRPSCPRPTSSPTFIRSRRSLLAFTADLYRSVLCAPSSSHQLYLSPTANATPTPSPHIQILHFGTDLFHHPWSGLGRWMKTLRCCFTVAVSVNSWTESREHLAVHKRFGENNRNIVGRRTVFVFLYQQRTVISQSAGGLVSF